MKNEKSELATAIVVERHARMRDDISKANLSDERKRITIEKLDRLEKELLEKIESDDRVEAPP